MPVLFWGYVWVKSPKVDDNPDINIQHENVTVKEYIQLMLPLGNEWEGTSVEGDGENPYFIDTGNIDDVRMLNIFARTMEEYLSYGMGHCSFEDLWSAAVYERVFSLVYNVEFEGDSHNELSVSYKTIGSMDMSLSTQPKMTYIYLTNPASYWDGFGGFEMQVFPNEEYKYMIESNLDFDRDESGVYSMASESLPQDIRFTMYPEEELTLNSSGLGETLGAWILIISILLMGGLAIAIRIRRRRTKDR